MCSSLSRSVAMLFLPRDAESVAKAHALFETVCKAEGLNVLGWRDVPTDPSFVGRFARANMPTIQQVGAFGGSEQGCACMCASSVTACWDIGQLHTSTATCWVHCTMQRGDQPNRLQASSSHIRTAYPNSMLISS